MFWRWSTGSRTGNEAGGLAWGMNWSVVIDLGPVAAEFRRCVLFETDVEPTSQSRFVGFPTAATERGPVDPHFLKLAYASFRVSLPSLSISFLIVRNLVRGVADQFFFRLEGQPPGLDHRRC